MLGKIIERQDTLNNIVTRESMSSRISQTALTAPVVIGSIIALFFTLRGRVDMQLFAYWAYFMTGATLARVVLCQWIKPRVNTANSAGLQRFELYLFTSSVISGIAIGCSFWMVAATGDLTVRVVITLISCFYAIGTLVNASSYFPGFVVAIALNLGQGILFWSGAWSANPSQYEVAFPYLAVALLVIGFGHDHSRRFRNSVEIRAENSGLLEQLGNDKRLLEQALEQARLASESKSRFLAAASHDLRQPLHAMTMFLGTLSFHVSSDDARRLLTRIKETATVLEEQFNSLLDLSKFDVGAVAPEPISFRLDRLVEKLVEEFRHEAENKQLVMTAAVCNATAFSDAALIERVLRNLLANAVKYTISGSVAVIVKERDGAFLVEVSDTGPGIPEDQQTRIFDEYVQLENPARQRRYGVGLGLNIVKRIDALLGLGLGLKSTLGSGSSFSFHVPRAAHGMTVSPHEHASIDITQFRTMATIWILDDDPIVLDGIREQLSAWGACVETFNVPTDLLARLRLGAALPHWILTDDMLGSALSGLETAQRLSSEFGFGRVCLITGNTDPQRLAQLRASGFPVIVKPAQPEALISIIKH